MRLGTVLPSNLNVFSVISRRPFHSWLIGWGGRMGVRGPVDQMGAVIAIGMLLITPSQPRRRRVSQSICHRATQAKHSPSIRPSIHARLTTTRLTST